MIPWAVLITGAVGVGGTALGAWLNGRTQTKTLRLSLNAENERARLAEKRRIYAACQGAFSEMITAMAMLRIARFDKDQTKSEQAIARFNTSRDAMYVAVADVRLIGSIDVCELANEMARTFIERTNAIISGESPPAATTDRSPIAELRSKLYRAMRADLGEKE